MEITFMSVEPFTLDIGRMMNKMGMVLKFGQTIPNMMDTIKKARKMEMGHISGLMDPNRAATGGLTK